VLHRSLRKLQNSFLFYSLLQFNPNHYSRLRTILQKVTEHGLQFVVLIVTIRNRTPTLIEMEDDTKSWDNFLVYFSHNIMPI
jgi:hypothetical protein